MIHHNMAIAAILFYKMPDCTATVTQIAEIASWSENEAKEILENLCKGRVLPMHTDLVVRNNTNPITYSLAEDTIIAIQEHQLDEYLFLRNKM